MHGAHNYSTGSSRKNFQAQKSLFEKSHFLCLFVRSFLFFFFFRFPNVRCVPQSNALMSKKLKAWKTTNTQKMAYREQNSWSFFFFTESIVLHQKQLQTLFFFYADDFTRNLIFDSISCIYFLFLVAIQHSTWKIKTLGMNDENRKKKNRFTVERPLLNIFLQIYQRKQSLELLALSLN